MVEKSAFVTALPESTTFEVIGDATVPCRLESVEDEYAALRTTVGLTDLSGCTLIAVEGPDADDVLGRAFSRDIEFLSPETSVLGLLLQEDARPLDIVMVLRTDEGFLLQCSVGQGSTTLAHLRGLTGDARIRRADELVAFGFEGPQAWELADRLLDEPITGLPFQGARPSRVDGTPVLVSRTGFTGEFGFQLIVPADRALDLWTAAAQHARPVGHEALETAMTEFRQPILHREVLPHRSTVTAAGLNWLVDLEKEDFIGRDALLAERDAEPSALAVCITSDAASLATGAPIGADDVTLGQVTHVVHSPGLAAWCGVAQVTPDVAGSGQTFAVIGTDALIQTVSAPIKVPTSWAGLLPADDTPEAER